MTHEEAFEKAERAGIDGAFTCIDAQHPVGIFLGIESGRRAVMVVCPERPPQRRLDRGEVVIEREKELKALGVMDTLVKPYKLPDITALLERAFAGKS